MSYFAIPDIDVQCLVRKAVVAILDDLNSILMREEAPERITDARFGLDATITGAG